MDRARRGDGPTLVEVVTHRFNEHSEGLKLGVDHRDPAERERWLKTDPRLRRPVLRHHGGSARVSVMRYLGAIGAAQREAMDADERVIIGEDVEANVYGTTGGSGKSRAAEGNFLQRYGPNRIRNTPISAHPSQHRVGVVTIEWQKATGVDPRM